MRRPQIYIMYNSDSSPSCDDSHATLNVMPKNEPSGVLILSASFPFWWVPLFLTHPSSYLWKMQPLPTFLMFKEIITPGHRDVNWFGYYFDFSFTWCRGQKPPTLMPADCSVLRTPTILPNIRISWDYHPTFMLISGRVLRSFTHLWASLCRLRPFDSGIFTL